MTGAELSKGSGAALELIRRLVDLGIVPRREGERPFVPGDLHRVRLAQPFERSGIPLEAIGTAIASGHLSFDFVDRCSATTPSSPARRSGRSPRSSASRWTR
jgi:hypothetical protein